MTEQKNSGRVAFHTVGCRLNQAETNGFADRFRELGWEIVSLESTYDLLVINSCTVTEEGDRDTVAVVRRSRRHNPKARVAVTGCMAELERERLAASGADWILGRDEKINLPLIVSGISDRHYLDDFEPFLIRRPLYRTRVIVKIQDGCPLPCTYCRVPFARGRKVRSKPVHDLTREIQQLEKSGVKEVVLSGVTIGLYRDGAVRLVDLVKTVLEETKTVRLRLSSMNVDFLRQDLLDIMKNESRLAPSLHLPIQSGSGRILKRMKRKYSPAMIEEKIQMAVETVPGVSLGTDVMTGFPGETEEDFRLTFEMVKKLDFHNIHVFSYSDRPLTEAVGFSPKVPRNIIRARASKLRALALEKRIEFQDRFVGKVQEMIVETVERGVSRGTTEYFIPVAVERELEASTAHRVVLREQTPNGTVYAEPYRAVPALTG